MGEDLNVKPEKLTELGLILEQVLANNVALNKEIQIESVKKDNREKYKLYVADEKKKKSKYKQQKNQSKTNKNKKKKAPKNKTTNTKK